MMLSAERELDLTVGREYATLVGNLTVKVLSYKNFHSDFCIFGGGNTAYP
jgi:hypothetical protein